MGCTPAASPKPERQRLLHQCPWHPCDAGGRGMHRCEVADSGEMCGGGQGINPHLPWPKRVTSRSRCPHDESLATSQTCTACGNACRCQPLSVPHRLRSPRLSAREQWAASEKGTLCRRAHCILPRAGKPTPGAFFWGRNGSPARTRVSVLQVWTWGEPWGQFTMVMDRRPKPVPGTANIAKIACGAFHNLALSWSASAGPASLCRASRPCAVRTPAPQDGTISHSLHLFAVQMGAEAAPVPVIPAGCCRESLRRRACTWVCARRQKLALGGGGNHCKELGRVAVSLVCLRCVGAARQGEVVAWGINDFGQLGNGTTSYATEPVKVLGLEDMKVADIAAGGWHSLAITSRGGEGHEEGRMDDQTGRQRTGLTGRPTHRLTEIYCRMDRCWWFWPS
jgi:Regulator of chromosome condensation (RCC1) repeat